MKYWALGFLFSGAVLAACTNSTDDAGGGTASPSATPVLSYSVGASYRHDTSYFTEGLQFYKGALLESTGLEGKSKLVWYDLPTGAVKQETSLPATQFGEGVSVFRDTVYQLTYQQGVVNVFTADGFKKIKELPFKGEGWGLTHDSTALIATNGSNKLFYYAPGTFQLLKEVEVTDNGVPAVNLNELEYINGYVYANQWQYNTILKIDPKSGQVVGKMDLTELVNRVRSGKGNIDFLNGIAYNPETRKVYVTGKYWPSIYEIQFAL